MSAEPNILFLNGTDDFAVRREIEKVVARIPEEARGMAVVRLHGDSLEDEDLLSEIITPAFGCQNKVVIVAASQRIRNKNLLVKAVEVCPPEVFLISLQDEPKFTNAKLAETVKGDPRVKVLSLYPPDARELSRRIQTFFSSKKLVLQPEAVQFLAETLQDDPNQMEMELEKIAMYHLGASEEKKISRAEVEPLVGYFDEVGLFDLTGAILERRRIDSLHQLTRYLSREGDLIPLIAVLITETWKLVQYAELKSEGKREDEIFRQIGVFFPRAQEATRRRAERFPLVLLYRLLGHVLEMERILKSEHLVSESVEHKKIHLPGRQYLLRAIFHFCR